MPLGHASVDFFMQLECEVHLSGEDENEGKYFGASD